MAIYGWACSEGRLHTSATQRCPWCHEDKGEELPIEPYERYEEIIPSEEATDYSEATTIDTTTDSY